MMRRVLVIGCQGQLGRELMTGFADQYLMTGVGHDELDIVNQDEVLRSVDFFQPEIVLLTAANANVDWCEAHPESARAVNTDGAANVAEACRRSGATLVYYSTDYVFDGRKREPYVESDETCPISVYGASKLAGERAIQAAGGDWTILRVSWFYSAHGRGFVRQIAQKGIQFSQLKKQGRAVPIDVVSDQFSNPTWTIDIVNQTRQVIDHHLTGLYHAAAIGGSSRPDLARLIFDELGLEADLREVSRKDYLGGSIRPAYSSLENAALDATGHHVMRDYREAIREFLRRHRRELLLTESPSQRRE